MVSLQSILLSCYAAAGSTNPLKRIEQCSGKLLTDQHHLEWCADRGLPKWALTVT